MIPNLFKSNLPLPQRLAAWGAAGLVFGAWMYFDKSDDGQVLTSADIAARNRDITGANHRMRKWKPKKKDDTTSET